MTAEVVQAINRRRLPGDEGVWFFIVADTMMFAVLFSVFIFSRNNAVELFEQGRMTLSVSVGFFNTLILLSSSALVALAVVAAREGSLRETQRYLQAGIAIGALFGVSKLYEYSDKVSAGYAINTNEFYMYYFALTGIHFFHYLAGMIILIVCLVKLKRLSGPDHAGYQVWLESAGCYWHMVDLLWIVLFPMIYLLQVTV